MTQELLVRLLGSDLAGDDVRVATHIISLLHDNYDKVFIIMYAVVCIKGIASNIYSIVQIYYHI